ncbi:clathrin assembly protein [Canna indica]|uniref:Clathrin assembly protein n=1 Tax=Canna indica TaxID=4628 RepID=A0AAQ3L7L1_9LILI|nr:clathrin assembly protein [Canna indica]
MGSTARVDVDDEDIIAPPLPDNMGLEGKRSGAGRHCLPLKEGAQLGCMLKAFDKLRHGYEHHRDLLFPLLLLLAGRSKGRELGFDVEVFLHSLRSSMGTLQSWRKAYGALKDTTTLSIAKVNSEFKDLDIAVVKATNHVECPPKERHVRKIFAATSANRPRSDVTYCVHALVRRLSKTRNWVVALKTLIVIHRTLREGDVTFREEILHYCHKARIFQLSYFKDDSSSIGAAFGNYLIQYALSLVLKESFKIYCGMNDGIINLVDLFFEMSRHEAIQALSIYKRAGQLAKNLSEFYDYCKSLELARNFQFPNLREPPPSFITTMEEYIREAPKVGSVSNQTLEYQEKNLLTYKQDESDPPESLEKPIVENSEPSPVESVEEAEPVTEVPFQTEMTGDLLGLDETSPVATELEESNALALAIFPSGGDSNSKNTADLFGMGDSSGWELALVTTPSNNNNQTTVNKLAGGFDKLLLDSLYDDAARRQQITMTYGGAQVANPFEPIDPFAMSSSFVPPPNVQMAQMAQQQQQQYYQQQQDMLIPQTYQSHYSHPQIASSNPFGDPFSAHPQTVQPVQGSYSFI